MTIDYQRTLLQVLIILIFVGVKYLCGRFMQGKKHVTLWWALTAVLFWLLAGWNFGLYWIAYPVAVWMILALALVVIQLVHNHEFLYRRYWPPFWHGSAWLAIISFGASIFAGSLPLV